MGKFDLATSGDGGYNRLVQKYAVNEATRNWETISISPFAYKIDGELIPAWNIWNILAWMNAWRLWVSSSGLDFFADRFNGDADESTKSEEKLDQKYLYPAWYQLYELEKQGKLTDEAIISTIKSASWDWKRERGVTY